jgi:chromosome segregation ATPase
MSDPEYYPDADHLHERDEWLDDETWQRGYEAGLAARQTAAENALRERDETSRDATRFGASGATVAAILAELAAERAAARAAERRFESYAEQLAEANCNLADTQETLLAVEARERMQREHIEALTAKLALLDADWKEQADQWSRAVARISEERDRLRTALETAHDSALCARLHAEGAAAHWTQDVLQTIEKALAQSEKGDAA